MRFITVLFARNLFIFPTVQPIEQDFLLSEHIGLIILSLLMPVVIFCFFSPCGHSFKIVEKVWEVRIKLISSISQFRSILIIFFFMKYSFV